MKPLYSILSIRGILLILMGLLSSCSTPIDPKLDNFLADDFEGGVLSSFWRTELYTPTAGRISTDQARSGRHSFRFSWKAAQADGTNLMMHSELATAPLPLGETERWYGYSSFMPSSSMANDEQTVIISQWHGTPNKGESDTVPPMCLEVASNNLNLWYAASSKPILELLQHPTSSKKLTLGPAIFDRWVDYVVHVKWSPTGKTGLIQIWQDGQLLYNVSGIDIGYPQIKQPYWKCGLYCWMAKDTYAEKVIYYDAIRIGDATASYQDVQPGN